MILTCPACATRFLVADLTIPAAGRDVRCGRCKHNWHQDPVIDLPDDGTGQTRPLAPEDGHPGALPPHPPLSWTPRPLPTPRMRRRRLWIPEAAASAVLLLALGGLLLFRNDVVAAWEPAARLYDSVGLSVPVTGEGLAIERLEVKTYRNADTTVLLVSGHIVNTRQDEMTVPPLIISVRDSAKRELMQWTHPLPRDQQALAPATTVAFHTQAAVDNELATNLLVRFGDAE